MGNTLESHIMAHSATKKSKLLFSVVIPISESAANVESAVRDLLRQTISFERSIEVILACHGNCSEAIDKLAPLCSEHPRNITLVDVRGKKKPDALNAGVSLARGMFINFLEPGYHWSNDAFLTAARFFLDHPDINIASAQVQPAPPADNSHPLSYIYELEAVVDVSRRPDSPLLTLANTFIARELLEGHEFNAAKGPAAAPLLLTEIVLDEGRYGAMSLPICWHDVTVTTLKTAGEEPADPESLRDLVNELAALPGPEPGSIAPYVQYCILWKMRQLLNENCAVATHSPVSEEPWRWAASLLAKIEDEPIVAQRTATLAERLHTLAMKHGVAFANLQRNLRILGGQVYWTPPDEASPLRLYQLSREGTARIDSIEGTRDGLIITGRLYSMFARPDVRVVAKCSPADVECELFDCEPEAFYNALENTYYSPVGFRVVVPPADFGLSIVIQGAALNMSLRFGKFAPIGRTKRSYARVGRFIVRCAPPYRIVSVEPASPLSVANRESQFELHAFRRRGKSEMWKAAAYRRLALAPDPPGRRQLWLVSDRPDLAGDNGEALFEHLCENPRPGVRAVFVLAADSPDFPRLSAMGETAAFGSREHLALMARADVLASSCADETMLNPFGSGRPMMKGAPGPRVVFLQHGVTKDDMSSWLNARRKDFSLFVTASERERESIVGDPHYGFTAEQVICTGFPRHDKLLERASLPGQPGRRVLVAPTWRSYLASPPDPDTGLRPPNPRFEDSDYFRFYRALIGDPRLNAEAARLGFEVRLLLHPTLAQEAGKFAGSPARVVADYDYASELAGAAALLTDFSSVAFDFALLKRPVVYAQFDREAFYAGHTYRPGYFDYARDGFGPVCGTVGEAVDALVACMRGGGMAPEYASRVDGFFFQPAGSRCEAVADAIERLVAREGRRDPRKAR